MFLKVFLVSSCLVLFITSMPTKGKSESEKNIVQLQYLWDPPQMICSSRLVQQINLIRTGTNNLCETIQETLCQIREALNECKCSGAKVQEVQNVLDNMKGNATCQLPENGSHSTKAFLRNVKTYIHSLVTVPCN